MTRRHRVLVVGAGSIGERHLRCFGATGRADVSFVEPGEPRRCEIAERYPHATAFADFDAAVAAGFDVAVVATPANLHIPQATRLVNAGVHTLIEKPLALADAGLDELRSAIDRAGVVVGVAYVHRANPALAEMRAAVASGAFGRPLEVVAVTGQNFPTYRPAYRQTYYASHATGGGAVQDALTHIVNAGEWLAGPVRRVVADVAHLALDGVDVEDTAHIITRQGDAGVLGSYSLNQFQSPNELTITVNCERGTVRYEAHENRWRSTIKPGDPWRDFPAEVPERDTLFVRQANAFLDAVEGKAAPVCTLAEGAATMRVNLAILESVRSGAWVSIGG